jgi:hypothetical protein
MGYEGHYISRNENPKDYLKSYLIQAYSVKCNVLDFKINKDNGFLLLENKETQNKFLILFNWEYKNNNEVVFKTMHEFDGAYGDFKISKAVLRKLTSVERYNGLGIDIGYCVEFRERMMQLLDKPKQVPMNVMVKTNEFVGFSNGLKSNIFKVIEKTVWNKTKFVNKKVVVCFDENLREMFYCKVNLKDYQFVILN